MRLPQNNENQNQKKTRRQNTENPKSCIYINMNKITPDFIVDDELLLD